MEIMPKFKIEVTETYSRVITVRAETVEDAIEKVSNRYKNSEIEIDSNDFQDYEINAL